MWSIVASVMLAAYGTIKAIHIIFVVSWFAGLFYLPRLFICLLYTSDAADE